MLKALIVSPEWEKLHPLSAILKDRSFDLHYERKINEALLLLKKENFDLVVCDQKFAAEEQKEFVKEGKKSSPESLFLLWDLLLKCLKPKGLRQSIEDAIQRLEELKKPNGGAKIIAKSRIMQSLLADARKIAQSHANVFISGESGTGKELLAAFIHAQSPRKNSSFIKLNCAALPENLIESELFGHEKGAFTGALSRRLGRFELADKGTLLLDEISELPLSLQSKLLRVVQEGEFERLGGMRSQQVDVRLISTSNRNMKEAICEDIFREDLYYRLNVVPIHLPPLRERAEDILPLAEHFIRKACEKNGKELKILSESAKECLLEHSFPGNIRELANLMEHTVVLDKADTIEAEHLPLEKMKVLPLEPTSFIPLHELEKEYILKILDHCNGNRTHASKILGIHVRTLRNKIKIYS
ncbi:MAG: sigma-54-dependent Fis family transcriptional regulator [Candidatus Algichlamydia australiensis]|nr:sigma-54-dependent Fis family transcriptional regulator [Chlamydiales bacterium]